VVTEAGVGDNQLAHVRVSSVAPPNGAEVAVVGLPHEVLPQVGSLVSIVDGVNSQAGNVRVAWNSANWEWDGLESE
jgi:hypothetical protein